MSTASDTLQPVMARGWQRGLANLLDHERHLRSAPRRWIVQLLLWILLINGSVLLFRTDAGPESLYVLLVELFIQLGIFCTIIGAVISAQGAIIQEKQMGTAAWVLSKPVSRSAFIVAKVVANFLAMLLFAVLIPAIVFYGEVYIFTGSAPAIPDMLAALGVWLLILLFYTSLAVMLGAFLNSRAAVLGIALGFFFLGTLLPRALPQSVAIFPWALDAVAFLLALGSGAPAPVPAFARVAIIATGLWSVIFIALAIWRFGREEF